MNEAKAPAHKPIVIRDQTRLGVARCLQLALSGMSYRMFRSGVTMAILALAVAFLTHMLVFGILEGRTQQAAYRTLEEQRALGAALTRLGSADSRAVVIATLAKAKPERLREYGVWSGKPPAEIGRASRAAADYERAALQLDQLPVAARAVVLGDRTPEELLFGIKDEAGLGRLVRQHADFAVRPPLGGGEALKKLVLEELPALAATAATIEAGHGKAIAELNAAYPGQRPKELAQNPPPGFAERLGALGFALDFELGRLSAFARRAADLELMQKLVLAANARAQIAREADIPVGDIDFELVAAHVDGSSKRAAWLARVLAESGAPKHLNAARVEELSQSFLHEREVELAVGSEAPEQMGFMGVSERSRWLVALSFLVCMVGVANAMLMSVTERFTEIATMKCLGALDGFVMMMFVLEAVIQGLVGGAVGLVLGFVLALARGAAEYGSLLSGSGGVAVDVLAAMGLSLVAGVVLAALSAIGPSFVAARLAPMEAMRVD